MSEDRNVHSSELINKSFENVVRMFTGDLKSFRNPVVLRASQVPTNVFEPIVVCIRAPSVREGDGYSLSRLQDDVWLDHGLSFSPRLLSESNTRN